MFYRSSYRAAVTGLLYIVFEKFSPLAKTKTEGRGRHGSYRKEENSGFIEA